MRHCLRGLVDSCRGRAVQRDRPRRGSRRSNPANELDGLIDCAFVPGEESERCKTRRAADAVRQCLSPGEGFIECRPRTRHVPEPSPDVTESSRIQRVAVPRSEARRPRGARRHPRRLPRHARGRPSAAHGRLGTECMRFTCEGSPLGRFRQLAPKRASLVGAPHRARSTQVAQASAGRRCVYAPIRGTVASSVSSHAVDVLALQLVLRPRDRPRTGDLRHRHVTRHIAVWTDFSRLEAM